MAKVRIVHEVCGRRVAVVDTERPNIPLVPRDGGGAAVPCRHCGRPGKPLLVPVNVERLLREVFAASMGDRVVRVPLAGDPARGLPIPV